jgi:hypothetical protein
VVEPVDDWDDLTYVLCNKAHSQFVTEQGNITGKEFRQLKDVDEEARKGFVALCKGKLL